MSFFVGNGTITTCVRGWYPFCWLVNDIAFCGDAVAEELVDAAADDDVDDDAESVGRDIEEEEEDGEAI